jgi:DNA-binding transcriptional ArsR family regulator
VNVTELLLHPVRLRVVHALSGGRQLTTGELCARMPEVSKVTVYRHVAVLVEAGYLEVADEHRVRGAIERRYRLRQDRPPVDDEAAAAMSLDDHRRGFAAAMVVLIAEFNTYLDREGANPTADSVSYRQGTLWLSPDELNQVIGKLLTVLQPSLGNQPAPGRAPYLLSPILFPSDAPLPAPEHESAAATSDRPSGPLTPVP